MRKSINTLSVLVEATMGMNPFDDALYVFANKRRDKLKLLTWDRTGFVLYYKKLEKQRFHWPRSSNERVTLDMQQLHWLLDGYNVMAMKPHDTLRYETVLGV